MRGLSLVLVALGLEQHFPHGVEEFCHFIVAELLCHGGNIGGVMPEIQTKIWMALRTRIEAISPAIPTAWPAEVFTPPVDSGSVPAPLPYLSIGKVTAPPQRVLIGRGKHWHTGSVTIVRVAPLGPPEEAHTEAAGKIAAHFPEDLLMPFMGVCVRVVSYPTVADGYRDGGYWRVPIIIPWRVAA